MTGGRTERALGRCVFRRRDSDQNRAFAAGPSGFGQRSGWNPSPNHGRISSGRREWGRMGGCFSYPQYSFVKNPGVSFFDSSHHRCGKLDRYVFSGKEAHLLSWRSAKQPLVTIYPPTVIALAGSCNDSILILPHFRPPVSPPISRGMAGARIGLATDTLCQPKNRVAVASSPGSVDFKLRSSFPLYRTTGRAKMF